MDLKLTIGQAKFSEMDFKVTIGQGTQYLSSNGVTLSDTQMDTIDEALGCQLNKNWDGSSSLLSPMNGIPGIIHLQNFEHIEKSTGEANIKAQKLAKFAYVKLLADKGKINAQYFLGKMYAENKQNRDAATYWIWAALQGSVHAQDGLIALRLQGGTEKYMSQGERDEIDGLPTERLAPQAKFELGKLLRTELNNLPKALVLFQEAADANVKGALTQLADLLTTGVTHTLSKDAVETYLMNAALNEKHPKAAKWFEELGDKYAETYFDTKIVSFSPFVTINCPEEAQKFYGIARHGSPDAESKYLGISKKRADQGDKDSAFIVAQAFVESDIALAHKYFVIAANAGHADAAIKVAEHLENHTDGTADSFAAAMKNALPFYTIAADGGNQTAILVRQAHQRISNLTDALNAQKAAETLKKQCKEGSAKLSYYKSLENNKHAECLKFAQKEGRQTIDNQARDINPDS